MHKKTTALLYSLIAFSTLHAAPTKTDDCGTTASPYRASARHIEGKGIGYKRGYTSVDLFMAPPSTLQHRFVPFIDARLHIFDNGKIATNAGIGLRYICSSFVYGINSYYDYRETSHQKYNQYSLGLEALGKVWDFRLNGYLPVGNKKSDFYNTRFGYFQGHNMYLNTTREFAMKGLNAEAGIHIKDLSFMKVYGAFGPYYFEKQGQNAIGGKVRASLTFLDHIKIEASTSYDPIFHWIGQGELSFMIPFGPKKKLKQQPNCRRPYLNERAVQQVDRQEIIVVDHKHYSPIAIDPTTNAPWNFVFVDNLSHSLGTYESPYPTLLEAQDNSVPRDIIYVFPGDGTDTGMDEGITLQLNQKLFGSGIDIPLATTMGEIVIPKQSSSFPLITNQVGEIAIVTLSDNNEVAGLNLTTDHTLSYGIVAGDPDHLTGLMINTSYIHDNIVHISNASVAGIGLATKSATVLNNDVATPVTTTGILIGSSDNLSSSLVSGNIITLEVGDNGTGIHLKAHDLSSTTVSSNIITLGAGVVEVGILLDPVNLSNTTLSDNIITLGAGGNGIGIELNSSTLSKTILSNNSITLGEGTAKQGIHCVSSDLSDISLFHNSITILGNGIDGKGIHLNSFDLSKVSLSYNSIKILGSGNGGQGILLDPSHDLSDVAMSYNSITLGNADDLYGIFLDLSHDLSDVAMSYNSVTLGDGANGYGIRLNSVGDLSDVAMSHNSITLGEGHDRYGIRLNSFSKLSDVAMFYNSVTLDNGNDGYGIRLQLSDDLSDLVMSHNSVRLGDGNNGHGIAVDSGNSSHISFSYNSAVLENRPDGSGIFLGTSDISDFSLSYNSVTIGSVGLGIELASSSISETIFLQNSTRVDTGNSIKVHSSSTTDDSCITLIDNIGNHPIFFENSGTKTLILNTPASHGNYPTPYSTSGPFSYATCGE